MKLLFLPVALFTLTAAQCATTTQPAIEVRQVEVPVLGPCLTEEELAELLEPATVGDQLGRTPETAEADRDILAGVSLALRIWGKTLYAAHKACAE